MKRILVLLAVTALVTALAVGTALAGPHGGVTPENSYRIQAW